MTDDLHTQRNGRDLTRFNFLQGAALLKLFRQARGREPLTDTEFREWINAQSLPTPLDPFAILTPEEINELDRRTE